MAGRWGAAPAAPDGQPLRRSARSQARAAAGGGEAKRAVYVDGPDIGLSSDSEGEAADTGPRFDFFEIEETVWVNINEGRRGASAWWPVRGRGGGLGDTPSSPKGKPLFGPSRRRRLSLHSNTLQKHAC